MSGLLNFADAPWGGGHMLLPEWDSQPLITGPWTIIDHSQVGSTDGTYLLFRDRSNLESHFSVRGRQSGLRDGRIEQFMSIDREAHANLDANRHGISIETEDDGDPDNQPWTSRQLESLAWLHERLLQLRPSIRRLEARDCDGPGLGHHTKLGAPSCWTPVVKTCPGRPVRVRQWEQVLLPAFLAGQEVNDMGTFEGFAGQGEDAFKRAVRAVLNEGTAPGQTSWASTNRAILATAQVLVNEGRSQAGTVAALINDVPSAVGAYLLAHPETHAMPEAERHLLAEEIAALDDDLEVDRLLVAMGIRLQTAPTS